MHPRPAHLGALLVAVAVLVAVPVRPAAAGESDKQKASDKAIVDAGKITEADVPGGWMPKPQPKGSSTEFKGVPGCKKQRSAADDARRHAKVGRSPQFSAPTSPGQATSAASTVHAFKTPKRASQLTDAFHLGSAPRCIQQQLDRSAGDAAGVGPATTAAITDLPAVGDDRVGYQSAVPLTSQGQTVLLYYEVMEYRAGRAVVSFAFTSLGQPFQQVADIVTPVVTRVQQAQA
jgi:hypothetical protein